MIPASNAKIMTALAILKKYSLDFVWKTQVYLNSENQITIVFAPDPLFTTESLYSLFDKLKAYAPSAKEISLDFSEITGAKKKEGIRAFEGEVSPYMFNFNASEIIASQDTVFSLPYISKKSVSKSDVSEPECGENSCFVPKNFSGTTYRSVLNAKENFLSTFINTAALFSLTKNISYEVPKNKGKQLFEFDSRPLKEVLQAVLRYSTNSLAEHLLYSLSRNGYSREGGILFLNDTLREISQNEHEKLADGSGLSRENKISPKTLIAAIDSLTKSNNSYIDFVSLLPQGGVSGTLKSRDFGIATSSIRAKTGSLDDVQSISGFLFSKSGATLEFSIIQNEVKSKEAAIKIEKDLLEKWFNEF